LDDSASILSNIGIGIMVSAAVLCNPYLILPLLLWILVIARRKRQILTILITTAACAVLYLLFILSRTKLDGVLSSLKYILNDPQHVGSVREKYQEMSKQIHLYTRMKGIKLTLLFSVLIFILRKKIPSYICIICFLSALIFQIRRVRFYSSAVVDVCLFPFAVALLPVIIMTIGEKRLVLEQIFYLEGWLVAVAFFLASNTYIDAMTVGFCICGYVGVLLIKPLLASIDEDITRIVHWQAILKPIVIVLILYNVIVPMTIQRFYGIYRDASIDQLSNRIEEGPATGLYTTLEHKEDYLAVYRDITQFFDNHKGSVLFSSRLPWAYLCTDSVCATPSCWTLKLSDERIEPYCKRHALPNYVVVLETFVGRYEEAPYNNHGGDSNPNRNEWSGWFWDQISEKGNIEYTDDYMTIYCIENT